ncbi:hypothetical protein [Marinagarivorans cellulosilyticus]|uniref:Uncharacterized protein n=1 Tax=Marinagarivorans cellulosilyticus TaxID=2721545 RepID=A0AAN1WGR8_9GAMM|nr:hypothetical protein [Marinagarivorans cellulosilyticus]BCD97311.1 hypothetical protein MARGE09_P1512 [Marinagarivorans cellulosilyticus]
MDDQDQRHETARPPEGMSEEELAKHPSWRRHTKSYQAKRGYVRDLWIYSGMLMIFMPLPLQVFCLAALSFISLSILDAEG